MLELDKLPYLNVIEKLDYESILNDIKSTFKEHLNDSEIELLQSDNYSALMQTLAYRELLLRARINESVKSMLLPYAEGADLDNIVAIYGISRLEGEKPQAVVKFSLSTSLESDVYIPAGLTLISQSGKSATLKDSLIIKAGETQITGVSVLDNNVAESAVKCELIQTPLPFLLEAKQESEFSGGAEVESDERLRERAILSLERFSTAGSKKSYIYQALSANVKVKEVAVLNGGPGVVNVYIKSEDESEETRQSVAEFLSDEKVRPLTDTVNVLNAEKKEINIKAVLELTDMFLQDEIMKNIDNFTKDLRLGQDLNLSYIYSLLHQSGVYRVNLASPLADTKANEHEFIWLSFDISFKEAQL